MITVIFATFELPEMKILNDRFSTSMLPLIDRPFIQHVIEYLTNQGITDFDVVLSHLPEKTKQLLGDGTRWGGQFRYHLVKDPSRPYKFLKLLPDINDDETVFITHANRLPDVKLKKEGLQTSSETFPVLYCSKKEPEQETNHSWSGWGMVKASCLKDIPDDVKEQLKFVFLETIEDLIKETLDIKLPKQQMLFANDVGGSGLVNQS